MLRIITITRPYTNYFLAFKTIEVPIPIKSITTDKQTKRITVDDLFTKAVPIEAIPQQAAIDYWYLACCAVLTMKVAKFALILNIFLRLKLLNHGVRS